MPTIEITVQVMFYDTDCAAVVHNLAYLRHIETARTLLAEKLGWHLASMSSTGLYPVLVRTEIDYKRPARLGDSLVITGWLEDVERSRFWCGFEMVRPADQTLLVTCRQQLALVQMPEGRPVRLPAEWRERWGKQARMTPDSP
ncbi:MAG: thioesterase family protein [Verrucomicrobiia bacterium]